jgi:hypothetical protein
MLKQVENLIDAGRQIQAYNWTENMSHRDEVKFILLNMQSMNCLMHPDSDESELLEFYAEDVLQPMLNYLDSIDADYFPREYIEECERNRKEFAESELGKAILGESQ